MIKSSKIEEVNTALELALEKVDRARESYQGIIDEQLPKLEAILEEVMIKQELETIFNCEDAKSDLEHNLAELSQALRDAKAVLDVV